MAVTACHARGPCGVCVEAKGCVVCVNGGRVCAYVQIKRIRDKVCESFLSCLSNYSFLSPLPAARMNKDDARALVAKALPKFEEAGLKPLASSEISDVQARAIASLWAGMGNVFKLTVKANNGTQNIIAKCVSLPPTCDSIGDQRKKDSYDVEKAFYGQGHAAKLIAAGAIVPTPLHVEGGAEQM